MKVKVISFPSFSRFCIFFCFTRPIYQVSVYRTTGPLVLEYQQKLAQLIFYDVKVRKPKGNFYCNSVTMATTK